MFSDLTWEVAVAGKESVSSVLLIAAFSLIQRFEGGYVRSICVGQIIYLKRTLILLPENDTLHLYNQNDSSQ